MLSPFGCFFFFGDSSSGSRRRKYLKLSKTSIKKCCKRGFWHLEIGLKCSVFISIPGQRASFHQSPTLSAPLRKKGVMWKHWLLCWEAGNVPANELACVLRSPLSCLSCLSFSAVLFPFLHFLHALLHLVIPLSFPQYYPRTSVQGQGCTAPVNIFTVSTLLLRSSWRQ